MVDLGAAKVRIKNGFFVAQYANESYVIFVTYTIPPFIKLLQIFYLPYNQYLHFYVRINVIINTEQILMLTIDLIARAKIKIFP